MIIDPSGRGPTMRQLLLTGLGGLLVLALVLGLLLARYRGDIGRTTVGVVANLARSSDELSQGADVKFRGLLVGSVAGVAVADRGNANLVHMDMKPEYMSTIPDNVTARVVPTNLFAVTVVELVYNGPDQRSLHAGSQIAEDRSAPTVALQSTLTAIHSVLARIDPVQLGRVLGTLSYALGGTDRVPGSTLNRLDDWLATLRADVPDVGGTLDDLAAAMRSLNNAAPDLTRALADSVNTSRTIVDKRGALAALLAGAGNTSDRARALFERNNGVGHQLTESASDTFGALVADPQALGAAITNLNTSLQALRPVFGWGPQRQMRWNIGLTFTPYQPYARADCPRYGELAGPSCGTAPEQSDPGRLPPAMTPRALDSAVGLPPQPPGDSAGAAANLFGDDAVAAILGREPNPLEYLLLRSVLQGGALQPSGGGDAK